MSGYTELRDLGVTFRPYEGALPPAGDIASPFDASWSSTVGTLARELRALDARNIVIELALGENDLRLDGLPRANVTLTSDAVRISFESKWGPLRYETNEFRGRYYRAMSGWQANVRAIALGMEALRKVDRYGVSKRGEQYRGWRQLTTSTDSADAIQTREQANAVLEQYRDGDVIGQDELVRRALMLTHPDRGGDTDAFRRVQRAREILES